MMHVEMMNRTVTIGCLDAPGPLSHKFVQDMMGAAGFEHRDRVQVICRPVTPAEPTKISDRFARDFYIRHDHKYSGIQIHEWLKGQEK